MSDFINTIDALGDDVVIDSIITKTITEFRDDTVTSIGDGVFAKCSSLTVVDTPAVTSIASYAFQYDTSLISINAPNVSGSLTSGVFQDCTSLESLDMPLITRVDRSALSACRALTHVCFPLATFLDTNSIRYCSSLISADFSSLTGFGGYVFAGADSIRALILRNTSSVVPLGSVYNLEYYDEYPFTKGEAYIYVPRALVDSYKTATNWSTFASKFRALEDYTVDGTVTGELPI